MTCPMPPNKYVAKFGLEPRLPGFRVHTTHFHITQPLVTNTGVFLKQSKERRIGGNGGGSQFFTVLETLNEGSLCQELC